jgi:NitT/TauT family transport system substrate-binding protein
MWPNAAANCIIVSVELIRTQPDLVEQIIQTHIKATDYANANPMEAAKIYSNRTHSIYRPSSTLCRPGLVD